jgi:7,8-didemethyl-8-hydroxy-5-deazariboflavin synthase CofG subunit
VARGLDAIEARARGGGPLADDEALALSEVSFREVPALVEAAATVRDRAFGKTVTFSPKVFLPVTNLCRNKCGYCSFRKSPGDPAMWTMSPSEVTDWIARGREQGCVEALLCLGDKPETSFPTYRAQLAEWGHETTVDYLVRVSGIALEHGLLPHTNAGLLTREDMALLRPLNVSLGLMLESASERLCGPGMPHHRAPDKQPHKRIRMIEEAGALAIPFTTGILIGIGETRRERIEALLEIRRLSRAFGHVQEVIVQSFRARPEIPMHAAPDPSDDDLFDAIALARLVLDDEVSVQAPPNLSPEGTAMMLRAGINDFGGISPVTPDYINPRHPWPHLERLGESCAHAGFALQPRLPIYPRWRQRREFLDPRLDTATRVCEERVTHSPVSP